jgi:hypothetical protein
MEPKKPVRCAARPLLMVDVDGVISLFATPQTLRAEDGVEAPEGSFHSIEGIPHFLSATAAAHLLALASLYDLVWASGWEDRADEHLPHLLGLPAGLPHLRLDRRVDEQRAPDPGGTIAGHWKLEAIDRFAGGRPLAWVDDALDEECERWAAARSAPTLLVSTEPRRGLMAPEAEILRSWALAQVPEPALR